MNEGGALAVFDTNVWLDLYFFADAGARPLAQALKQGRLQAVRSAATDGELAAVLARPQFAAADPTLLARWQAQARAVEAIGDAPWACSDRDDQKFLDLAWSCRARLLLSKDRALLALARRARADGLEILTPVGAGGLLAEHGLP